MERVYIDVGAHRGASLGVALDPRFGFDRLIAFEPAENCAQFLNCYRDSRIEVHQVALGDYDGSAILHAAGSVGGSIYEDKEFRSTHSPHAREPIRVIDAGKWFHSNIDKNALIVLKINCEGAELAVFMSIVKAGYLDHIDHILIDLDIRKVPSLASSERELRALLENHACNVLLREELGSTSVPSAIKTWLESLDIEVPSPIGARLKHGLMLDRPEGVGLHVGIARILRIFGLDDWVRARSNRN